MRKIPSPDFKERFYSNAIKFNGGCWIWLKQISPKGYAYFYFQGKNVRAHRLSYAITKGQVLKNDLVLHTCDTPSCINPDHLYVGTQADNMRDRANRNRVRNQYGKPNCIHGHKFEKDSYVIDKTTGARLCLKCRKTRNSLRDRRNVMSIKINKLKI